MHLFRLLLLFVVLVEKLIVLRKAERNQFADLGAMTGPCQKFFFRADAAGTVKTETVRFVEELNVRQSSVFVLLQPHTASPGQSRYFLALKTSSLRLSPTMATMSPVTFRQNMAASPSETFMILRPLRVWAMMWFSSMIKP